MTVKIYIGRNGRLHGWRGSKNLSFERPFLSEVRNSYWVVHKDLVINDITKKQWRKFNQKFSNNKILLKKDDLSDERRKRLEDFNKWFEANRPPRGKRGRPKKDNASTIH